MNQKNQIIEALEDYEGDEFFVTDALLGFIETLPLTPVNEGQQQPVQGEGFTGGEWKVEYTKEGYNDNIWVVSDCKKAGFVIASLERSASIQGANDEAEANARLIAEAKNMYAALINLVDVWDRGDMHLYPQGKEMLKKAKAIISRIK